MISTFLKYLRNSAVTISITINPFNWIYIPRIYKSSDPWASYTYTFSFLFLSVSTFISDGSW